MIAINEKTDEERAKLKEERKIRNQQKKLTKRLSSQKKRDEEALQLKIQPKCNYVKLVTRDVADILQGNSSSNTLSECERDFVIDNSDFPALNTKCKVVPKNNMESLNYNLESGSKKRLTKIELSDFLCSSSSSKKQTKVQPVRITQYSGNPLDSDMPVRKRGKFREVPKVKKVSSLKKQILIDKSEQIVETGHDEIKLFSRYMTEEKEKLLKSFISTIVDLQQKLFQRNPMRGTYKKRYVVGLHEVKKYMQLNRVKILCLATDIKTLNPNDALSEKINELIELSKTNGVPYVFALKRRLLGKLTLKSVPVSCIAVLNYEGVEAVYDELVKQVKSEPSEDATKTDLINNFMNSLKCN